MELSNLHWPQITFITLLVIHALLLANRHGKEKMGVYDFWSEGLVNIILNVLILYYGGFFLGNQP